MTVVRRARTRWATTDMDGKVILPAGSAGDVLRVRFEVDDRTDEGQRALVTLRFPGGREAEYEEDDLEPVL